MSGKSPSKIEMVQTEEWDASSDVESKGETSTVSARKKWDKKQNQK